MKNTDKVAVTDGAVIDHGQDLLPRHPCHLVGFVAVVADQRSQQLVR